MSLIGEVDMLYICTISQYQITRWWQLLGQSWVAAYLQSLMRLWFPRRGLRCQTATPVIFHALGWLCPDAATGRCLTSGLLWWMSAGLGWQTLVGLAREDEWPIERSAGLCPTGRGVKWGPRSVGGRVREVRQVDTSHL